VILRHPTNTSLTDVFATFATSLRPTRRFTQNPDERVARPTFDVDVRETLRRCAAWRSAFRGAEVTVPARLLTLPSAAPWLRRHRVSVEASSTDELALALAIPRARVVFDGEGAPVRRLKHAVSLGAGTFVVGTEGEIMTLSATVQRRQRVLLDVTDVRCDYLIDVVLGQEYLDLTGVRYQLGVSDEGANIDEALRRIAAFLDYQAIRVSSICLAVATPVGRPPGDPRELAARVGEAVAKRRGPLCHPALSVGVSVDWQTLASKD
jgi:pyridoxal-dependent decarboxylase-like protein